MSSRASVVNIKEQVFYAEDLLLAGTPMVVFDLETTGLDPKKERILSFAAIKVVYANGLPYIQEQKSILMNPEKHIPDYLTENVHHISDADVADCPTERDCFDDIREFFGDRPFLCGYNSTRFDQQFIEAMYDRVTGEAFQPLFHIDVLQMAREKLSLDSYKLENVAKEMGISAGLTFHQADDDMIATFRIFNMLRAEYHAVQEEEKYVGQIETARYWYRSHQLERIYVTTVPRSKTYYDIYRKEWVSDIDLDVHAVRDTLFARYGVQNEKDLVALVKAETLKQ